MKNLIFLLAGMIIFLGCGPKETTEKETKPQTTENINPMAQQEAVESANAWLALIDSEKYAESWDEAAQIFQNSISKEEWETTVKNVRANFGKYLEREIKSTTFTKSLPGAPDGEYVVIQFETKFEKKKNAVETITPVKEDDGSWRVSGYFIK